MNENINLCKILKGHQGRDFYNPLLGNIMLVNIYDNFVIFRYKGTNVSIKSNGCDAHGNLSIFPSETETDWNEWDKLNNNKIKTWKDYLNQYDINEQPNDMMIELTGSNGHGWTHRKSPTEKAALALIKIMTLIDKGYGGIVSNFEWGSQMTEKWIIFPTTTSNNFTIACTNMFGSKSHVSFHTKEQAMEFLKHPENIDLLNQYFVI